MPAMPHIVPSFRAFPASSVLPHELGLIGSELASERFAIEVQRLADDDRVAFGIVLLMIFYLSYLASLSWADLSYIMPATTFGYVLTALLAHFMLGEHVPLTRWIGIIMITAGVGFITGGPSLTVIPTPEGVSPHLEAHP